MSATLVTRLADAWSFARLISVVLVVARLASTSFSSGRTAQVGTIPTSSVTDYRSLADYLGEEIVDAEGQRLKMETLQRPDLVVAAIVRHMGSRTT